MSVSFSGIKDIVQRVKSKKVNAVEVCKYYISKYRQWEPYLKAVLSFSEEDAIASAERIDRIISSGGDPGPPGRPGHWPRPRPHAPAQGDGLGPAARGVLAAKARDSRPRPRRF